MKEIKFKMGKKEKKRIAKTLLFMNDYCDFGEMYHWDYLATFCFVKKRF